MKQKKTKKVKTDMLRSNSKSLGNRVVSPEEEEERLQWEGFAEKEGSKSGMKRAFRCCAPAVWNSLPKTVLNSDSVAVLSLG